MNNKPTKISTQAEIDDYIATLSDNKAIQEKIARQLGLALEKSESAIYATKIATGIEIGIEIKAGDAREKVSQLSRDIYEALPEEGIQVWEVLDALLLTAAKIADDTGLSYSAVTYGETECAIRKEGSQGERIEKELVKDRAKKAMH